MAIKTYKIQCKVTLQSYMEDKPVDLTPHIRSLRIKKDLYRPAGSFEIQLLPGTDKYSASWYYRTSPMDYIEIRFTRDSSLKEIPIIMRGFVSDVGSSASLDPEGRPQRIYTISGSDMGIIFDLTRIYFLPSLKTDLALSGLPGFEKIGQKYGCNIDGTPAQIVKTLFEIAADQLSLIRQSQSSVPEMKCLCSASIPGAVNQFALSQEDGSIWDLMAFFDNSPWNELFTVDLEDAPYLVFRETPWKDYDSGSYIQTIDPDVEEKTLKSPVSMEPNSIIRFGLKRSHRETKNYFFTYPTQNLHQGETSFKAQVLGTPVNSMNEYDSNPYCVDHDNRDAGSYRFGFRRFENTSEYFDISDIPASVALAEQLNQALHDAFKYNSAYESGSFTLKGNANLRPGCYMRFDYRTGVNPEYYVVGVNHELNFMPGNESFTSTVNVQRGDGYLRTRNMAAGPDEAMRKALK